MFLEELTVRNFGLFRGEQKLDFTPHLPEKPVILIGGLNGSGKTTLLDSIQIALYGKRARISNRGSLSYEEYLRRSINNDTANEETSITLQFRRWSDGREQVFTVRRFWKEVRETVVENILVMRDGSPDKYLTETWSEFVEEIIPVEIAQLFFFDGEKIESFADPETSRQLLAKAVNTLLGLDVVTRLQADLIALERRKQIALKSDKEREKIVELEAAIKVLETRREDLILKRAGQQNEVDRRGKDLRAAQENYNRGGGSLFEKREELENERNKLKTDLRENDDELREIVEGAAPLLLVGDLLVAVKLQHEKEKKAAKAALVNQTLKTRDAQLLQLVRSLKLSAENSRKIKNFLSDDRVRRAGNATIEIYLNTSSDCYQDLRDLQSSTLPQIETDIADSLGYNEELQTRLVDAERKLASVPAQDLVTELISKRDAAQAALAEAENNLTLIDADLKRLADEHWTVQSDLTALLENTVSERFEAEDAGRILDHSKQARETMAKFRRAVTSRHTGRIAALVLDSFRHLLRKKTLISDLTIDAETFAIRIADAAGRTLSPDRLSAGERQLLAVSILWGLARASGYPLPVAVDTPLGRLDDAHRDNLVENYFPQASHQVILLSTNKEIDVDLFSKLEPFVGRTYCLEYDDQTKATQIKTGYFGIYTSQSQTITA